MQHNNCMRDKQCSTPVIFCKRCDGEIYREDMVFVWEGAYLCGACMEDKISVMTTREKAELLGAEPVLAAEICFPETRRCKGD